MLAVLVLGWAGRGHAQDAPGTVGEAQLPGGIRAAFAAVDDRVSPDRGLFLLEFIRRTYHTPIGVKNDRRDTALQALLAELDFAARRKGPFAAPLDTVPLPLSPQIWIETVFGGRATPETLVATILRSRGASLLYCGLMALDDGTRAWLATDRGLIADLATKHAAPFVTAAPALRVVASTVRVPGGEAAQPVWEALVGRRAEQPAQFVRALLTQDEGRLAYFFGAIAQLPPARIHAALSLESAEPSARVDAGRRLYGVFERLANGWKVEDRAFSRPVLDPALLIAELPMDAEGRLVLPGTRPFWAAVFGEEEQTRSKQGRQESAESLSAGAPVDIAWLSEQVFRGAPMEYRRRYPLVLFASRVVKTITPANAQHALEAVRSVLAFPALAAVLERSKVTDVTVYAAAARRAASISAIEDDARMARAAAQYQSLLAVVTRAAVRGSLTPDAVSRLVLSLSAVELNDKGEYEGRLARWLTTTHSKDLFSAPQAPAAARGSEEIDPLDSAAGPLERDVLRLVAGSASGGPRVVDWEGTRYRVDLPRGETARLTRLLGHDPRPYLSSARTLVEMSDALSDPALKRERLRNEAGLFQQTARAVGWDDEDGNAPRRYREVAALLERAAKDADVVSAASLAPALRLFADDLLARGLLEVVYAVALGHPDRTIITAGDAAGRHDFGFRAGRGFGGDMWALPMPGGDSARGWRVTGSVLGLDVRLSEFLLVRLSARPPPRRPTINDEDRRLLIESVALVDPTSLDDSDRDLIAAAIRDGRARVAAVKTPAAALSLADEIRLDPARRTVFAWEIAHDPQRAGVFLSPAELLWAGLGTRAASPALHAWGAVGQPRLGCLCLNLVDRQPATMYMGRWSTGIFVSAFPDLNLRLAELLADLKMPATLLGPVLGSAMLDFINGATTRDQDDRRGLVEFVQALRADRLEQYLALLTTDGPLVPIGDSQEGRR